MISSSRRALRPLFDRGSWPEVRRIGDVLRAETVGGLLLVGAAVLALVWANSPWRDTYVALSEWRVGPAGLHLDLTLGTWAADGLLAIFFFVAGLELKREFVAGDLRDPRRALLPVAAAVGGMAVPALLYLAAERARTDGWSVGDPHRNRHRVRPGRAGRHQHPSARCLAGLPAHAGSRRRSVGHHHHRDLLHRPGCTWFRCCSPCSRSGCSRCW